MRTKITTILWDLDGTLINSEELYHQASTHATFQLQKKYHLDLLPISMDTTGLANQTVFELLLPASLNQNRRALFEQWEQFIISYMMANLAPQQGITQSLALVKEFYKLGLCQSVVSNSPTKLVAHALKTLKVDNYCHYIFGLDQVANSKPHPALYHKALNKCAQAPQQCLAFEDSQAGISAAKAAGIHVVGIGVSSQVYSPELVCDLRLNDWLPNLTNNYSFSAPTP